MSEADRATWRKHAEECVELARITTDQAAKQLLLSRAQIWLKLAYANGDAEFERIQLEFNKEQMAYEAKSRPVMVPGAAIQQQPVQQQQSKIQPDDNGSPEQ